MVLFIFFISCNMVFAQGGSYSGSWENHRGQIIPQHLEEKTIMVIIYPKYISAATIVEIFGGSVVFPSQVLLGKSQGYNSGGNSWGNSWGNRGNSGYSRGNLGYNSGGWGNGQNQHKRR